MLPPAAKGRTVCHGQLVRAAAHPAKHAGACDAANPTAPQGGSKAQTPRPTARVAGSTRPCSAPAFGGGTLRPHAAHLAGVAAPPCTRRAATACFPMRVMRHACACRRPWCQHHAHKGFSWLRAHIHARGGKRPAPSGKAAGTQPGRKHRAASRRPGAALPARQPRKRPVIPPWAHCPLHPARGPRPCGARGANAGAPFRFAAAFCRRGQH